MNTEEKENLNDFKWKTRTGEFVSMMDMEEAHLKNALFRVCVEEAEAFNRVNTFAGLRDQLEKVAEARGIVVEYPDLKFPSPKWDRYFQQMRRIRAENKKEDTAVATSSTETEKAKELKEENTSLD
jgi:hypothetical protein